MFGYWYRTPCLWIERHVFGVFGARPRAAQPEVSPAEDEDDRPAEDEDDRPAEDEDDRPAEDEDDDHEFEDLWPNEYRTPDEWDAREEAVRDAKRARREEEAVYAAKRARRGSAPAALPRPQAVLQAAVAAPCEHAACKELRKELRRSVALIENLHADRDVLRGEIRQLQADLKALQAATVPSV